jgi:hypothetical protein
MSKTIFILLILFSTIGISFSQSDSEINRKGLIGAISTGVHFSKLTYRNNPSNQFGQALDWKIGYMVKPKLAIVLNGAISIYDNEVNGRPRKRDFGGLFPSLQYYTNDKFWFLAGAGIGTDAPVFYDIKPDLEEETKYYSGLGLVASAGYSLFEKSKYTLDLQFRVNYSHVKTPIEPTNGLNFALLAGINFK